MSHVSTGLVKQDLGHAQEGLQQSLGKLDLRYREGVLGLGPVACGSARARLRRSQSRKGGE